MSFGQNFPVSEYYKDQIIDAETVSRAGGWWTAVLLIRDPKTQKPFIGIYRWQMDGETWKTRKSISFKSAEQANAVIEAMRRLGGTVGNATETALANPTESSVDEPHRQEELQKRKYSAPRERQVKSSEVPLEGADSNHSVLAAEWERVRRAFGNDTRTIGELEVLTGMLWLGSHQADPIALYVNLDWGHLISKRHMDLRKIERLIKLLSAAK